MNDLKVSPNFTGKLPKNPVFDVTNACKRLGRQLDKAPEAQLARINRQATISTQYDKNNLVGLVLKYKKDNAEVSSMLMKKPLGQFKDSLGKNCRETVKLVLKGMEDCKSYFNKVMYK